MKTKRKSHLTWIVVVFALLHAVFCLSCRSLGIEDSRALTLLTVAMTFILCYKKNFKLYSTIASIILVIVVAYLVGSALPGILMPLVGETMWANVISTFLTTLLLGLTFDFGTSLALKSPTGAPLAEMRQFRPRWIVRLNDRIVPVKTEQIAYFFSENKSNYLVTFDGSRYVVDSTMDGIMENLDPAAFFRINRGAILSLACIDSATVDAGRYMVEVHPALGISNIVTRSRVKDFLSWMENQ